MRPHEGLDRLRCRLDSVLHNLIQARVKGLAKAKINNWTSPIKPEIKGPKTITALLNNEVQEGRQDLVEVVVEEGSDYLKIKKHRYGVYVVNIRNLNWIKRLDTFWIGQALQYWLESLGRINLWVYLVLFWIA